MKKIIYTALIMLIIMSCIHGMKQEKNPIKSEEISCKKNAEVSFKELILEQERTNGFSRKMESRTDVLPTPRKQEPTKLPAVDLIFEKRLYFLGKDKHQQKSIFSQKFLQTNITAERYPYVTFLSYKKPYFFYKIKTMNEANALRFSTQSYLPSPNLVKHNKPIFSFGAIENTVFSGSTWPSIKKSIPLLSPLKKILKTEPFIDNAFLLACQGNGMIIAKVNSENNAKFWFWRRFNTPKDVHVTLYALFFEQENIINITKKKVETALDKAKKTLSETNKIYTKNNITVVTIASNVVLTAEQQRNPNKKFPKAAISNNTALIMHMQRYPDSDNDSFTAQNPAVSIAYKDKNKWKTDQFFLNIISKQKLIKNKNIRLPDLYEIKNIYITEHNKKPLALLVSKTDGLGFCADGVYAIPLTGQEKDDLPEPFWHVDIVYNKTTTLWKPIEKIVASTFDYKNKRLFLITESIPKKPIATVNQQLITIDVIEAMNNPKRLAKIPASLKE